MINGLIFLESQLIAIILLAVSLICNKHLAKNNLKHIAKMGILTIFVSVMEILFVVCYDSAILNILFYVLCFGLYGFIGFLWYRYHSDKFKKILLIPAIFQIVFSLFGAVSGIVMIGAYVLLSWTVIFADKRKISEKLKMASFGIPLLAGSVFTLIKPDGINVMPYAVLLSIIMVYSSVQHKKVITDNLTKLPNRYGMDEEIEDQLQEYRRDKSDSFYVIACDMDNFKTINDTWGHQEGDRALTMIADVLESVASKNNSAVFRIGGDEFVIITENSEVGIADKVCDELKTELDELDFRDDFDIRMTMGVSFYDGSCTVSELINNADKKLYTAKNKNKIK